MSIYARFSCFLLKEILIPLFNPLYFLFLICFRENFLQLDIFYKQMSYEEITQQEAYDPFALICEYQKLINQVMFFSSAN